MTDSNHTTRKHALCSASGAMRWINCPGSVGLNLSIPPLPSNKYAEEGTRAHEVAERALKLFLKNNQVWSDSFLEPGDMGLHIKKYIEVIHSALKEFDSSPDCKIEVNLTLDKSLGLRGIADFAATGTIRGIPTGTIVDLKYGKAPVKAKENPQLAYYACALRETSAKPLENVIVVICQPRVEDGITRVLYNRAELDLWSLMLKKAADKALWQVLMKEQAEFKVGAWCKYCAAAKGACKVKNPEPPPDAGLEFSEL